MATKGNLPKWENLNYYPPPLVRLHKPRSCTMLDDVNSGDLYAR
jgi:hypothetical protein